MADMGLIQWEMALRGEPTLRFKFYTEACIIENQNKSKPRETEKNRRHHQKSAEAHASGNEKH